MYDQTTVMRQNSSSARSVQTPSTSPHVRGKWMVPSVRALVSGREGPGCPCLAELDRGGDEYRLQRIGEYNGEKSDRYLVSEDMDTSRVIVIVKKN